jgi:hypothetical protein
VVEEHSRTIRAAYPSAHWVAVRLELPLKPSNLRL